MVSEIVILMNTVNQNSQLLRTLIADPQVPADQKQLMQAQIANNSKLIREVSAESEVVNA